MGNEKFVGREETPHLRGVNFERVLNGQDPIRESMNLLRAAIVRLTGIKDQVRIGKVQPTFSEPVADHSDAAKTDDAVVFAKSSSVKNSKAIEWAG